ncbi:MAG: LPS export ABC transporter periplasmic protein LptC [Flavobacteriaceae bacterium]|jgi:LPS export ABC transporter protein LptC|nr:LPS export ABC transporter periplasmic protein LptC [Flavobacteriaceae bacterium]MBT6705634.1 LPS export ABC transporter periplasmic protein LptC [Flavobacteriaceae bacterium]MBT7242837.1 LPS export ABC transporter periplasmic protein LptC [Flavobacteriaceae bacterium]
MSIFKYMFKSVMIILAIIAFFSCEGNYKNIQKMNLKDDEPVAVGKTINLKFTDSGKVTVNLIAPLLKDYSNFKFPYREFPEGITLYFWDEDEKSTVTSDYAVEYKSTGLVDLRGNVTITTSDSTIVNANQLYWDQINKWIFTNQSYQIKFADGSYNDGSQFDSNQEFTTFLSRKNQGVQLIDKNETINGK